MKSLAEISCLRQLWKHLNEAEEILYDLRLNNRADVLDLDIVDKMQKMRKIVVEDLEEMGGDLV